MDAMSNKIEPLAIYTDYTSPEAGEIEVHAGPPFIARWHIVPYMPPKGPGPKMLRIKYEKHIEQFETPDGMTVKLVSYVMKAAET